MAPKQLSLPLPLAGRSAAARSATSAYLAAAGRKAAVLIEAEAGCRPEDIASALHEFRASHPFVAIDCRSDDPGSIDHRLFGSVRRSADVQELESATADSAIVESARGTLFLDHVDELPASAQRRLARVLRDGEVRLGQRNARTAFRLIAATTRDLEHEAREGRFREDLLRRLTKCRIAIAPLRRRSADIPDILERLARGGSNGSCPAAFTDEAVAVLASMPWTRNLDELCELVDRLAANGGGTLTAEQVLAHASLQPALGRMDLTASLRDARRQFEREYIAAVLERHQWSMSEAARTLGIERANLYRKTRQLGITRGSRETWTVL